ncbi:unnamed protein product [Linum trigynum]|uniref:Uncharacterized protein n=1 Tax=Linum trigynum TaxID=586398 RepID=A0AAV2FPW4_9ROSI
MLLVTLTTCPPLPRTSWEPILQLSRTDFFHEPRQVTDMLKTSCWRACDRSATCFKLVGDGVSTRPANITQKQQKTTWARRRDWVGGGSVVFSFPSSPQGSLVGFIRLLLLLRRNDAV